MDYEMKKITFFWSVVACLAIVLVLTLTLAVSLSLRDEDKSRDDGEFYKPPEEIPTEEILTYLDVTSAYTPTTVMVFPSTTSFFV
jgi:hypothetical protein